MAQVGCRGLLPGASTSQRRATATSTFTAEESNHGIGTAGSYSSGVLSVGAQNDLAHQVLLLHGQCPRGAFSDRYNCGRITICVAIWAICCAHTTASVWGGTAGMQSDAGHTVLLVSCQCTHPESAVRSSIPPQLPQDC